MSSTVEQVLNTVGQVASSPIVADVVNTVGSAVAGNVVGAVADGVKVVQDVAGFFEGSPSAPATSVVGQVEQALPGIASTVGQVLSQVAGSAAQQAAPAVAAAGDGAAKLAEAMYHLVSSGIVALVERELGQAVPADARDRLVSFFKGLLSAASQLATL